jgi:hypothetical protein
MPNNRVQREIEEILEKQERKPPRRVTVRRPMRRPRGPSGPLITPERLIVAGLLVLLVGVALRGRFLVPLAITGAGLLAVGYFMSVRRRRGGTRISAETPQKYWRGQPVGHHSRSSTRRSGRVLEFPDSWPNRLRRWFGMRRR